MNKDKEWLIKRVENYIPLNDKTVGHVVDNILDIICQLDEPEVLSQEWVNKNVVHIRGLGDIFEAEKVENLLVPKQELPVIPQFVADWIEHCKENNLDLYEAFGHSDMSVEVSDFIGDMDADEFARAWLDGYEIEKEKLYYVINDTQQLMLANIGYAKPTLIGFEFVKQVGFLKKYQLTEKEIKEYDERYWTFAVEVTE